MRRESDQHCLLQHCTGSSHGPSVLRVSPWSAAATLHKVSHTLPVHIVILCVLHVAIRKSIPSDLPTFLLVVVCGWIWLQKIAATLSNWQTARISHEWLWLAKMWLVPLMLCHNVFVVFQLSRQVYRRFTTPCNSKSVSLL